MQRPVHEIDIVLVQGSKVNRFVAFIVVEEHRSL